MLKKYANQFIVHRLRRRVITLLRDHDLTIIVVTGTVGKTSAKLAIGQVLTKLGRKVSFSEDSYNTEIGIPLAMFGVQVPNRLKSPAAWRTLFRTIDRELLNYPYDTLVLEIAEDERAMMTPWLELLQPHISVLTNVSEAHMARFKSLDKLRDDAIYLASQAKTIYYNADNEIIARPLARKKVSHGFGLESGEIRCVDLRRSINGTLSGTLVLGEQQQKIKTQLVATHGLGALLAAAGVALELGYPKAKIAAALGSVPAVKGRMRLLPAINGAHLLDDTYNSSPAAVMAGLDTLLDIKGKRHIAVLGSMNEMGEHSAALHREVAEYAASKKLDLLVTVGKEAATYIVPAAIDAGMDKSHVKQFKTPYEAGHYLKKLIQSKDVIFVKGSQNGVFTEETSRILLSPDLSAAQELVRQSKAWKKIKKKSFGL